MPLSFFVSALQKHFDKQTNLREVFNLHRLLLLEVNLAQNSVGDRNMAKLYLHRRNWGTSTPPHTQREMATKMPPWQLCSWRWPVARLVETLPRQRTLVWLSSWPGDIPKLSPKKQKHGEITMKNTIPKREKAQQTSIIRFFRKKWWMTHLLRTKRCTPWSLTASPLKKMLVGRLSHFPLGFRSLFRCECLLAILSPLSVRFDPRSDMAAKKPSFGGFPKAN